MPREKYTDNIAYLFKKKDNVKGASPNREWETEGLPFYCSKGMTTKRTFNPIAGMYKYSSDEVLRTTTQVRERYGVDFDEYDRIAFTPTPRNDVNQQDYSIIISVIEKPYKQEGNKHRTANYSEYEIKTS